MDAYPNNFDPIWKKYESGGFDSLSETERLVFCVWWLEGEVNNGGFHQFFFNSYGGFYEDVRSSLVAIGATKTKALLEKACGIAFNGATPPRDLEKRRELLNEKGDDLIDELTPLDDTFYKYEDDIQGLVNAHLNRIGT